ncbi:ATP-binding protein [Azospirillum argentinense]|nr:ATP-binding protein [Azospirillum argentinense]
MDQLATLLQREALVEGVYQHCVQIGTWVWLEGPSGVGKSWIVQAIGERWREEGGDLVLCFGNSGRSFLELAPWISTADVLDGRKAQSGYDLASIGLRALPGGSALSGFVDWLAKRRESGLDFLSSGMIRVLGALERSCLKTNILVIVDDVQYLDDASKKFLLALADPAVHARFRFAGRASFLIVRTPEHDAVGSTALLSQIRALAPHVMSVPPCSRDKFPAVLKELGIRVSMDDGVMDALYDVTKGHLKLAAELVVILNNADGTLPGWKDGAVPDFLSAVIRTRMHHVERLIASSAHLLKAAACLGLSFSKRELSCAFGNDAVFERVLAAAKREALLDGDDELRFRHEILRNGVLTGMAEETPEYHRKICACLVAIRPSDYALRLYHAAAAGDRDTADALAFMVETQVLRGELSVRARDDAFAAAGHDATRHQDRVANLATAIAAIDGGRYDDAIAICSAFADADEMVEAETAYWLGLAYYKQRTAAAYERARTTLLEWHYLKREPELWSRISATLLTVLATLDRHDEATALERELKAHCRSRRTYDPAAKDMYYAVLRKAEVLYPAELATPFIRQAVSHFGPSSPSDLPRHPFQYVAALTNLSGNLFTLGRFDEASRAGQEALTAYMRLGDIHRLVEPYKVANNAYIAAFRAGDMAAEQAAAMLAASIGGDLLLQDRILCRNNLAVLHLLAGDYGRAETEFAGAYEHVMGKGLDAYYRAFVTSNYAALLRVSGHHERAAGVWAEHRGAVAALSDELRRVLSRRADLLAARFADATPVTMHQWDGVLLDEEPLVSALWDGLRHGFLMSDIQVWSES